MSHNFPKLSAIIIGTNNLEKAKIFYKSVFCISIEHEDSTYVLSKSPDGQTIEIEMLNEHRFPNWKKHNVGTYKNTEFIVTDIYEFFKTVQANGGSIVSEPKLRPWGSYAGEIKDPDGNIFLITQKN